ncbi:MAG TPA: response regulator [Anaeromyxobacteraceae bacterium]|nr:response regulator [Anaeromyxobacteraceae bacterium]
MPNSERPSVLVVEDRPSVLLLVATVLERACEVLTASRGEEALGIVGSRPLDVVLTDVRMPGASGFDVLRAVTERSPETQVVLMTAYANIPDAVAAIKLGAYDYVAKPVDADELALVIARAVEQARLEAGGLDGGGAAREGGRFGEAGELAGAPACFHTAVEQARARASREYLTALMQTYAGNVTRAAARAGMTRESLHRVLRKYGVHAERSGNAPRGEPAARGDGAV